MTTPSAIMFETILSAVDLQKFLTWLTGISLSTFLLSIFLIPFLVSRLSPDCFISLCSMPAHKPQRNAVDLGLLIIRNFFGLFLVITGVAMLFLPGQGILTILLGLILLSLPGKQRLISYLINFPSIRKGLNWLRLKSGKEPFIWPER